jgi:16S rRNA (guanine527-N7)-methyltransferase
VRPDLKITAMDSTAKRVNYVAETAKLLGLDNLTAVTMRAEDGGKDPSYREKFDYATARAVAEMRILTELTLPFVKVGGQLVAMKGKNAEFELTAAKKAIATLGGRNTVCENITLKGNGETLTHPFIIIDKKEKTPSNLPRPYAQISKKPL